jgi:hypothetical protein
MKENTFLGTVLAIIDEVGIMLGLYILLSLSIAALFAPAFQCILEEPIFKKMALSTNVGEQTYLRQQLRMLKKILWGIAILSWAFLIFENVYFNNLGSLGF